MVIVTAPLSSVLEYPLPHTQSASVVIEFPIKSIKHITFVNSGPLCPGSGASQMVLKCGRGSEPPSPHIPPPPPRAQCPWAALILGSPGEMDLSREQSLAVSLLIVRPSWPSFDQGDLRKRGSNAQPPQSFVCGSRTSPPFMNTPWCHRTVSTHPAYTEHPLLAKNCANPGDSAEQVPELHSCPRLLSPSLGSTA